MTKSIRIENADTSDWKVRVEIHQITEDKDGVLTDRIVKEVDIDHPAQVFQDYLWSGQYFVVRENGPSKYVYTEKKA